MTPPLDARAKRSQEALMKAGLELLNINPEASLSEIASHAGVGRTTLYRQYETREKLISAIAVYCLNTIDEATAPIDRQAKSVMDAVRLLFELAMPLTKEFQFLVNLEHMVKDDAEIQAIIEKQDKELTEMVEYGKKLGEISTDLPTSWIVDLIEELFYLGWKQQKDKGRTAQEAARFAFVTFKKGAA